MDKRTLQVAQVIRRTETIVSIRLSGEEMPVFSPGQFFKVYTKDNLWRYLSAASSPRRPYLEFSKRLTGSPFSLSLEAAVPGMPVTVEGPYGRFTVHGTESKLLLMAGGIGITPFMSMLDDAFQTRSDRDTVLLFSNRSYEETPYRQELSEFSATIPLRVVFFCREPHEGVLTGRIDRRRIEELVPDASERICLIAGPPSMVEGLKEEAAALIPGSRLLTEQLTGYAQGG